MGVVYTRTHSAWGKESHTCVLLMVQLTWSLSHCFCCFLFSFLSNSNTCSVSFCSHWSLAWIEHACRIRIMRYIHTYVSYKWSDGWIHVGRMMEMRKLTCFIHAHHVSDTNGLICCTCTSMSAIHFLVSVSSLATLVNTYMPHREKRLCEFMSLYVALFPGTACSVFYL